MSPQICRSCIGAGRKFIPVSKTHPTTKEIYTVQEMVVCVSCGGSGIAK